MSTTLHILVDHQNGVRWWLVLNYMRTPPTHYFLESDGRAAYMKNSPFANFPTSNDLPWTPPASNVSPHYDIGVT